MRFVWHGLIAIALTLLTQIGGVIWLLSRLLPKYRLVGFVVLYGVASLALTYAAPLWGRERLPAFASESIKPASFIYPALNRNFVSQDMRPLLESIEADRALIGDVYYLDGGFPIGDMPLLPHLSHKDGRKLDFALFYEGGGLRSPIGYFAFEYPEAETCPDVFPSLRWDFRFLQGLWADIPLDDTRMRTFVSWVETRGVEAGVEKAFLEPHLAARYGANTAIFRFQGCRPARHDDHFHIQIK